MSDSPFPPRRVSDELQRIDITDYLFPWFAGQPQLVHVHGSDDFFIPVFSSEDKLVAALRHFNVVYDAIKVIINRDKFLGSLPARLESGERIRIMVDPWVNEAGNTQFTELYRPDIHGLN